MKNHRFKAFPTVNQPLLAPALTHAGVGVLHEKGLSGAGISIGHLDSGVSSTQPELMTQLTAFAAINNARQVTLTNQPIDDKGHGSQTAGLIVGKCRRRMLVGVAPNASLVVGKVLEGGNSIVRILAGFNWLAEKQVPIILLCAGLPNNNPVFGSMLYHLRQSNILVICPIGNDGPGKFRQPGDDPYVLSVGAIDPNDQAAHFSGSRVGRFSHDVKAPDILANGVSLPCFNLNGGLTKGHGTSLSAAITAGVAALLLEAVPEATADQLYDALCYGSTALNDHTRKHARCGVLNAELALEYLKKNQGKPTQPKPERPPLAQPGWRDPRLLYQINHTDANDTLMGVYIRNEQELIEKWEAKTKDILNPLFQEIPPQTIDYLPRGKAIIISAAPELHRKLIDHKPITYASAADAGRILVPNKTNSSK